MPNVPAGGPSTIYGIRYQMLWSLLRAVHLRFDVVARDDDAGGITAAQLILEPRGGGGDLQEVGRGRRIVQQLKAKSGGGTWSLAEIVQDILPDLYLAVD